MYYGILALSSIAAINIAVVAGIWKYRKEKAFTLSAVLLSTVISVTIIQIFSTIIIGFSESVSWFLISVFFLGIICFLICAVTALILEYWSNSKTTVS
jgi:hypothetical protein